MSSLAPFLAACGRGESAKTLAQQPAKKPAQPPAQRPLAKQPAKPLAHPPAKKPALPVPKQPAKPLAKPPVKPLAQPPAKKPALPFAKQEAKPLSTTPATASAKRPAKKPADPIEWPHCCKGRDVTLCFNLVRQDEAHLCPGGHVWHAACVKRYRRAEDEIAEQLPPGHRRQRVRELNAYFGVGNSYYWPVEIPDDEQ